MRLNVSTRIVPLHKTYYKAIKKVDMKTLIGFLIVMMSLNSYAQNQQEIDQMQKLLETSTSGDEKIDVARKLFKATLHRDKEKSFGYLQKGISISKEHNDLKGLGTAYADLGMYYRFDAQPDSSRYYYKKGITTLQKIAPSTRLVDTHDDYGTCLLYTSPSPRD